MHHSLSTAISEARSRGARVIWRGDGCYEIIGGAPGPGYVDLDGNPVERNPEDWPYSYDAYVVYKSEEYQKTDRWTYSDRMSQWDRDKYDNAKKAVWPKNPCGQCFDGKSPKDINKFLDICFGREVKLTAILKGCNVSNGYPYWIFVHRDI
jgi:hypothetical protein